MYHYTYVFWITVFCSHFFVNQKKSRKCTVLLLVVQFGHALPFPLNAAALFLHLMFWTLWFFSLAQVPDRFFFELTEVYSHSTTATTCNFVPATNSVWKLLAHTCVHFRLQWENFDTANTLSNDVENSVLARTHANAAMIPYDAASHSHK